MNPWFIFWKQNIWSIKCKKPAIFHVLNLSSRPSIWKAIVVSPFVSETPKKKEKGVFPFLIPYFYLTRNYNIKPSYKNYNLIWAYIYICIFLCTNIYKEKGLKLHNRIHVNIFFVSEYYPKLEWCQACQLLITLFGILHLSQFNLDKCSELDWLKKLL